MPIHPVPKVQLQVAGARAGHLQLVEVVEQLDGTFLLWCDVVTPAGAVVGHVGTHGHIAHNVEPADMPHDWTTASTCPICQGGVTRTASTGRHAQYVQQALGQKA